MKGLIFDMDGTMIDNMMIHHRAWQHQLKTLGIDFTIEEVKEKIHGVNVEILKRLFGERFNDEERIKISREKEEAYRKIYAPELKLITGLEDFLTKVQQAGIPMAIGTAAPPENANFVLDHLNLRPYFTGIVHAGDVQKGKPDPEVFIKAAKTMNLAVQDCLIFEDSVTGAEAASRAGSPSVIVTTTHTPPEFEQFSNIQQFINDFTELDQNLIFR